MPIDSEPIDDAPEVLALFEDFIRSALPPGGRFYGWDEWRIISEGSSARPLPRRLQV